MTLYELIIKYAADLATAKKWDAVAAVLADKTVEQRSSGLTSFKQFVELFGIDTAEVVLQGWSTSEVGKSLRTQLEVKGLDFADDQTIELIDKLDSQSKWQTGIAKKLKELGVRLVSPAEAEGIADPTAEQCKVVWNYSSLNSEWVAAQNDGGINEALSTGDRVSFVASLRKSADQIEAG